jgi:hypothetical protein
MSAENVEIIREATDTYRRGARESAVEAAEATERARR